MKTDISSTTKLCPHCQKEIPKGARKCPECQSDLSPWYRRHPIISAIGVIFLVGVVLGSLGNARDAASSANRNGSDASDSNNERVSIGDNGHLRITGTTTDVTVFTSRSALDAYTKAAVVKDTYGMAEIIFDGEGYFLPTGTKVLLIDYGGIGEGEVRILEGDHLGEAAWVPTDFISAN